MKLITPQIRRARAGSQERPTNRRASVEVHIDALVLHGFSRPEGFRAAAALQRELTRLVTDQGLPGVSASRSGDIDAGAITAVPARPELTGIRAARAVHGGLLT